MIFYLSIYFSASFFIYLYSKVDDKFWALVFKSVSFLILFTPLALRKNIGVDYEPYVEMIELMKYDYNDLYIEKIWIKFIQLLNYFNLPNQLFFIIPAFLTLFILYNIFHKKYAYLGIITYLTAFYYIYSYNQIRQFLGISIFLLAIKSFINKRRLYMLFWMCLASLLHKSLVVSSLILLLCELPFQFFLKSGVSYIILCIIYIFYYFDLNNILSIIAQYSFYGQYTEDLRFNQPGEINTGLGVVLKFLMYAFSLFLINKFKNYNLRIYKITLIFILCSATIELLAFNFSIYSRILYNFYIVILFIPICLYNYNIKFKQICMLGLLIYLFIFYNIALYRAINGEPGYGGHGIYPYISIFD